MQVPLQGRWAGPRVWTCPMCFSRGAAPALFFHPLQPAAHSFPTPFAWVQPGLCQSRLLLSAPAWREFEQLGNVCRASGASDLGVWQSFVKILMKWAVWRKNNYENPAANETNTTFAPFHGDFKTQKTEQRLMQWTLMYPSSSFNNHQVFASWLHLWTLVHVCCLRETSKTLPFTSCKYISMPLRQK